MNSQYNNSLKQNIPQQGNPYYGMMGQQGYNNNNNYNQGYMQNNRNNYQQYIYILTCLEWETKG